MVAHLYSYDEKSLILQIDDGFGEIAPLPGWSTETFKEAKEELLRFLLHQKKVTLPSVRWGCFCARFPLTSVKTPLCALHKPRAKCGTVKIKASSVADTISQVKPLVGKYLIRLDCNRAWNLDQALAFANHFSPSDFEYLEEPVQTINELIQFSKISGFPIALDETYRESGMIELPTLKAVVIKPTLSGSIPDLSIPTVLSSSYESSLGLLQIARHAKADMAHGLDTFEEDLLSPPLKVEEGHLIWAPSKNPIRMEKLCHIVTVP